MLRKQSSNTVVSRKKCKYKFSIVQYLRCVFFFSFDGDSWRPLCRHASSDPLQAPDFKVPLTRKSITVPPKVPRENVDLVFIIRYDISLSGALVPLPMFVGASPQFGFPLSKTALPRSCRQENRDRDHAWLFIDWIKRPRSIMIIE
jgi:hypothetical protein